MNAAQRRIGEYLRFGSKLGLERMEALCSMLGNPESGLRVIHVAGTNGKGSVCRYIYDMLLALGYTAGIFTSPYVMDFRERIEVNGEFISEEQLDRLTDRVLEAAEILSGRGDPPTEFEIVTAIGFLFFSEKAPDFVLLEVGLGGSGDSTNVISSPLVSIITQIAIDHTDRLGDTVEKIAGEKAGIIKKGCPVISGATGAAQKVIAGRAYELGAPFTDSSKIKYKITEKTPLGYTFDTVIGSRRYEGMALSMAGEHQVQNAVTALCAIDLLRGKKLIRSDGEALRRGIKAARIEARFQLVSESPAVVFDGAHNQSGAQALTKTLKELFPDGRALFVCSILKEKAAADMIEAFKTAAAAFITTASSNERSLSAEELSARIKKAGGVVMAEAMAPKEAYNIAMDHAEEYDVIVFAGSLYMIGDLLNEIDWKG